MRKRNLRRLVLLLIGALVALGGAGCTAQRVINDLPAGRSDFVNGSCSGVYREVEVSWGNKTIKDYQVNVLGYYKTDDGNNFSLIVESGGELIAIDKGFVSECASDYRKSCIPSASYNALKSCIEEKTVEGNFSTSEESWGVYGGGDFPGEGTVVEIPGVSSGTSSYPIEDTAAPVDSGGGSNSPAINISPGDVSYESQFIWRKPDGTEVPQDSAEAAIQAAGGSEGGTAVEIKIPKVSLSFGDVSLGELASLGYYPTETVLGAFNACDVPVDLESPLDPYFQDSFSGKFAKTQEAAIAFAKKRSEASDVVQYVRCVPGDVVYRVPLFTPPAELPNISAEEVYYGYRPGSMPPDSPWQYHSTLSRDFSALHGVLWAHRDGGTIQPFRRGDLAGGATVILPWYPPISWCIAKGVSNGGTPEESQQKCSAFEAPVDVPVWHVSSGEHHYYATYEVAVLMAEIYAGPHFTRVRPGGDVELWCRGEPCSEEVYSEKGFEGPTYVDLWNVVPGLPDDWDANLPYYGYIGGTFTSLDELLNASNERWLAWYLLRPKETITVFRRGVLMEEMRPPARWALPLSIVLSLLILVLGIRKLMRWYHSANNWKNERDTAVLLTLYRVFGAFRVLLTLLLYLAPLSFFAVGSVVALKQGDIIKLGLYLVVLTVYVLIGFSLRNSKKIFWQVKPLIDVISKDSKK